LQEFRILEALLSGFTPVPEKSESMYDLTLKLRSGELKPHTLVFARKKTENQKSAWVEQKYLYLLNYTNRYGEKISSAETRPVTTTEFPPCRSLHRYSHLQNKRSCMCRSGTAIGGVFCQSPQQWQHQDSRCGHRQHHFQVVQLERI
jgi:hypothetical protein